MKSELTKLIEELTGLIKSSYEESITVSEAEKLAGRFLEAQLQLTKALSSADLDSRMKKSGLKALKAGTYLEAATGGEKKPSDTLLNNIVDDNDAVKLAQAEFDSAEVYKDELYNYFSIFRESHIHFRTIARGSFGG